MSLIATNAFGTYLEGTCYWRNIKSNQQSESNCPWRAVETDFFVVVTKSAVQFDMYNKQRR